MDLLRASGSPPRLVGHRGASEVAPENTLASFERARRDGADIVELDVRLTADGQVVAIHDDTVDRTTDGTGRVSAMTLAELRALDAGSWFGPDFAGEPIPTLTEVLDWAQGRVGLFLELKYDRDGQPPDPRLVPAVVRALEVRAMVEEVALISFHVQPLVDAALLAPGLQVGPMDRRDRWGERWAWLTRGLPWLMRLDVLRRRLLRPLRWMDSVGGTLLSPNIDVVTRPLVDAAHRRGIPICPGGLRWDYPRALVLGVDTISANDPGAVRRTYLEPLAAA